MAVEAKSDDEEDQVTPEVYLMDEVKIERFVKELGQKLIYEYDFLQLHAFQLELTEFIEAVAHRHYPHITASKGTLELKDNLNIEDTQRLKQELLSEFESLVRNDMDDEDDDGSDSESDNDDDY